MGTNTIPARGAGPIAISHVNDLRSAMIGPWVGRDPSTGAPDDQQDNGTSTFPWKRAFITELILDGSALDAATLGLGQNFVKSGKVRTTSNQPAFITPAGAAGGASFTVAGSATDLVLDIDGTQLTMSADLVESGLSLAPSTNNTALVNDTEAGDEEHTRTWGEKFAAKDSITIDNVGSEISSRVGETKAFLINNGSTTEAFIAKIDTSTSLNQIKRGFFYDSTLAPVNRVFFSNNDTITLLELAWVFLENNGTTVEVTNNAPTWSFTEPTGPATNDYWFDSQNDRWKKFDGATFNNANQILIGVVALDDTDCLYARCETFRKEWNILNDIEATDTNSTVDGSNKDGVINVNGTFVRFRESPSSWDMTADLAIAADMYDSTEQASREYYFYVSDLGEEIISDISPYYEPERFGYYHPHNPWRAAGRDFNNASSNLTFFIPYPGQPHDEPIAQTYGPGVGNVGSSNTLSGSFVVISLGQTGSGIPAQTQSGDIIEIISNTTWRFKKKGMYQSVFHGTWDNTSTAKTTVRFNFFKDGITDGEIFRFIFDINDTGEEKYLQQMNMWKADDIISTYDLRGIVDAGGGAIENVALGFIYLGRIFD